MDYRRCFAKRWRDFVCGNFRSPAHVAYVFDVDPKTAQNWWEGTNAPQGWVIARAISNEEIGPALIRHLGGQA
ncbi:hypothetical protein [Marinibacterium profundimaris]|uniref:Antitoxin Xre/MbcA/ParS-like toxin-binding domain-containing protein n=1 Tax=Marinibacterium profundimaris TaxID=1679460 RepID=A0A225NRP3_9RHOB|nr:hypothetical protein [Marinibacterium profundimaris]OWU77614.1 hypothetical protein ATO3_02725 [Marinibacterium profundimaris]